MNKLLHSERFKTILLIVLFVSTVLLSNIYLHGETFTGLGESVNHKLSSSEFTTNEIPDVSNLVRPASLSVSFGDGTFDLLNENTSVLWDEFLPIYISFTEMKNLMVEEISQDQWNESMEFSSIMFNFGYDVSNEYFEGQGASNYGQNDYFTSIGSIGCSEAANTAIFIRNETQNKYFRITADSEFFDLEATLSSIKSGTTTSGKSFSGSESTHLYYPTNMLIGSKNRTYLPYQVSFSMKPINISQNSTETSDRNLAETFFGKGLNFIRKITDNNGTIMYMYGYNQKALSIYKDGNIEYTDNSSSSEKQLNFNDALEKAVEFISAHGTWSSDSQNISNYFLRKATIGTSGRSTIYRFSFKTYIYNFPVFYNTDDEFDIVVELTGDNVTYYSRSLLSMPYISFASETGIIEDNSEIYSILAENYAEIAKILIESGSQIALQGDTYGENMEDVLDKLVSIFPGYYSPEYNPQTLAPAWVCKFDSCYIFYDLYSGTFLGYIKAGDN